MTWPPTPSKELLHVTVTILPPGVSGTAAHPASAIPPSLNLTVPVGAVPLTVAVNTTWFPDIDGLGELVRPVVLPFRPTPWDSAGLVDPALMASPANTAVMLCTPAAMAALVQVAVRVLPLPVKATVPHPVSVVAPSLKFTVPVGDAAPVTVAVNVTLVAGGDGLSELASVSELGALLTTCGSATLEVAACVLSPA